MGVDNDVNADQITKFKVTFADVVAAGTPNPVVSGLMALSANPTAATTGRGVNQLGTLIGAAVVKPFSIPEADWSYAAAGAGIRNYVTGVSLSNNSATATDFQIRDGAAGTVLYRGMLAANAPTVNILFPTPLKGTANTLIEIACGTTAAAVYANLTGYIAP